MTPILDYIKEQGVSDMKWLYKNWWCHNIIAHPLMQFVHYINPAWADALHNSTLPEGYEI